MVVVFDEVPLPTVERLAAVVAVRATNLGRLDRLTVDAPGRGDWFSARTAAGLDAKGVVEGCPCPVIPPLLEVVLHILPGGEVMGKGTRELNRSIPLAVSSKEGRGAQQPVASYAHKKW